MADLGLQDIPVAGTELYPGEADDTEVPSLGKAPRHLTLDFTDGPASAVASTAATAPGEGPAQPPAPGAAPGSGTASAAAAALAQAALGDAVQAFEIDPDFDYCTTPWSSRNRTGLMPRWGCPPNHDSRRATLHAWILRFGSRLEEAKGALSNRDG